MGASSIQEMFACFLSWFLSYTDGKWLLGEDGLDQGCTDRLGALNQFRKTLPISIKETKQLSTDEGQEQNSKTSEADCKRDLRVRLVSGRQ